MTRHGPNAIRPNAEITFSFCYSTKWLEYLVKTPHFPNPELKFRIPSFDRTTEMQGRKAIWLKHQPDESHVAERYDLI